MSGNKKEELVLKRAPDWRKYKEITSGRKHSYGDIYIVRSVFRQSFSLSIIPDRDGFSGEGSIAIVWIGYAFLVLWSGDGFMPVIFLLDM